jgi:GR25 family glycosyltransferase involved in LPS biosynthesis
MSSHHIIILNLDRSTDRKDALKKRFKSNELSNYTFWPALDGKDIINAQVNIPIIKGYGKGRNLKTTEIAIIMSHIAALKHAQVMNYDNVVILEDDVDICDDWDYRIAVLLKSIPKDWEYVYLAGHSDYVTIPKYEQPTIMTAPKMVGAFSYMVNQKGIKKLIKYCTELITTYDDMIMHKISAQKLKGYLYLPFMTYHAAHDSLVWDETPGHLAHINNMHSSYKYFKKTI